MGDVWQKRADEVAKRKPVPTGKVHLHFTLASYEGQGHWAVVGRRSILCGTARCVLAWVELRGPS